MIFSDDVIKAKLARFELPLLALSAVSIGLYISWLYGFWGYEEHGAYFFLAATIDFIFVVDLLAKLFVRRMKYVRTPWFLVDFISTIPAVFLFLPVNGMGPSLRALRGFRFLRLIRTIRALNMLKNMTLPEDEAAETQEDASFNRAMFGAIGTFTLSYVILLEWLYLDIGDQQELLVHARKQESFLIFGTVLGLVLILWVVKFQLPAVAKKHVSQLLNVALPQQVAKHFMAYPDAYNQTVRMPGTVIFCDIQGFTTAVENLGHDLDKFKQHLECAMDAIVEVHAKHDLIVDKFIGDCVMSFRGGNLVKGDQQDHAYRVVRAAIESTAKIKELDDPHFKRIRIGGASGDELLIGAFGTSRRLSYTVLGDRVNLAARLESACKKTHTENLFCKHTHDLLTERKDIVWRRLGDLEIRGKKETVAIFEAFDNAGDLEWIDTFNQGVAAMEAGEKMAAIALFQDADTQRDGGDPAAISLIATLGQD